MSRHLATIFEKVRPTIVAFASRWVATVPGAQPLFPEIIGTGFIVDGGGLVVTNAHVIEALRAIPNKPGCKESAAMAILMTEVQTKEGMHHMGTLFTSIAGYHMLESFVPDGPYYGERLPDFGFVQLLVRDVPALPLATERGAIRVGLDIATAGFPTGTAGLTAYDKVSQLTPFLRRGIISSVLPFPCPSPHGFTVDIMSQGGASGSPIFFADDARAVGILHAAFNVTNITYAVPSHIIADGLQATLAQPDRPSPDSLPTLADLIESSDRTSELGWEIAPSLLGKKK